MSDEFRAQIDAELDLSKVEQQIHKINNTSVKLKVEVEGDSAKKMAEAIKRGLKSINVPDLSQQLIDSFNISNPKVASQVRRQVNQMTAEMAKAFDGNRINGANLSDKFEKIFDNLVQTIAQGSNSAKSQMSNFYKSFYDDYKNTLVYISDDMERAMGSAYASISQSGRITKDATKGIDLNSIWDEMSSRHPDIIDGQLANAQDQIFAFIKAMRDAKSELKQTLSFDDLDINLQTEIMDDVSSGVTGLATRIKSELEQSIGNAAEELKSEFIIDVSVNTDKIISDIRQAIQMVSSPEQPIDISLNLNESELLSKLQTAINSISAENIPIEIDENNIRNSIHSAIQNLPLEEILVTIDEAELLAEIQRVAGNATADITLSVNQAQLESDIRTALSGIDLPLDFLIDENDLRDQIRAAVAGLSDLEVDVSINAVNLQNSIQNAIHQIPPLEIDLDVLNHVNAAGREGQDVFSAFGNTMQDAFSAYTLANLLERGIDEVVESGQKAVETVKELNDAATDLMMATGSDRSAVNQMIDDYRELGNELGSLTLDVSSSADEWLRQGKTAEETTTLIKDSVVLSKVGQLDAADATEYLTSAMNGYKVAVEDVEGIIDRLSAVDLESAYDAGQLAEAMSKTATGADLAGISMDRLIAMISTVGETTKKSASTVGNSLQTIFSRMRDIQNGNFKSIGEDGTIEDLSNVEIVLKQMGIQLRSSNDEFRSFQDVLDDIAGSWDSFTSVQQASISEVIAGTRQSENFLVLMENYDKVRKYTEIAANSSGTAQAKFQDAYMSSLEAKTNQLKNSLEELAADTLTEDMYSGFLDVAKAAADVARETDLINTAFAGLSSGGATYALTHIVRLLQNTATEITALGGGLTGFMRLLGQHPVALVATAVTAVAGAINLYQANIEKAVESAKEAGDEFSENITSLDDYAARITELRTALESGTLTEEEAYTAKSNLLDIQTQLSESYGNQVSGIDLVNGSLEEQIGLLEQLSVAEAQRFLNENVDGNKTIKSEMEKVRKYGLGTLYNSDDENEINAIRQAIADAEAEYGDFIDFQEDENGAYVDIVLNADASTSRDVLNSLMTDLTEIEERFGSSGLVEDVIGNVSDALGDAKGIVEEHGATYEKIMNAELIANPKQFGIAADKMKTAKQWLEEYTEAIENYNEAILSGDDTQIQETKVAFEELDSTISYLTKASGMIEYVDSFSEARKKLNDEAIQFNEAYDNFVDAINGKQVESPKAAGTRANIYTKQLQGMKLTDVDFMSAALTEGDQLGEDAINGVISAAKDLGLITGQSETDVQKLCNILIELGIIATGTADDVSGAGSDIADAFDTATTSTSEVLEKINVAKSALSSQATGQSISIDAFTAEGMEDYQSALEYVNGTMQLNAEMVEEITKAKAEEQIAINDVTKAQKQAKYLENAAQIETLRQKIEDNNFATGESADSIQLQIDSLLESNDAIVNQCGQLDILNASLRESIGTYQAWKNAQNAPESGDMFDDTLTALQQIDDVLNNEDSDLYGRIGRDDYKTSLDLVIPETVNREDTDAVNNYLDSIYSMFTHDEDGDRTGLNIENFCQEAVDKGLMVLDEAGESYQVAGGKTMEDFAEGLNLAMPLVQAMFGEMEEFGGQFDWADEAIRTIGDLGVTATEAAEALRGIAGNETLKINLDVSDIESKEDKISALDATIQEMDGYKATLSVDSAEYEQANSIIQYCVAQKQQLNEPAVMSVDTSLVQGKVGEAVALLQQFRTAQNELEMQASVGMDTSEAQANVDALAQQIQGLDANVTAALNIDTTSIDTINASLAGMTPELLVKAGIDESAIIGYVPQNKTATVKYGVDSTAVDAYNPSNLTRTVTYNVVTNGSAPSGGSIGVNGTAHVNGTAKSGKALASGDWGTKKSGTTLVGELGREIVVDPRTGRWYTVGDNGAEFVNIPKNAIVFNHIQSQSLLEQGYVAARGTALAGGNTNLAGTAMVTGGIKVSQTQKSTENNTTNNTVTKQNTAAVNKNTQTQNKNTKTQTKNLDSFKTWTGKLKDWIVVKIERLRESIDLFTAKSENATGYKAQNKELDNALSKVAKSITTNEKAITKYETQLDKIKSEAVASKLVKGDNKKERTARADALIDKIKSGSYNINEYGEKEQEFIKTYEEYWQKVVDCTQAVEELKQEQIELAQQKFDNITEEYDGMLSQIEYSSDLINSAMEEAELRGYAESKVYYESLIKSTKSSIAEMEAERTALQQSLAESMKDGIIKVGDDEWYDMKSQINDVTLEIETANNAILEMNNAIRDIDWSTFDTLQERISGIATEADFLINLMGDEKMFDEDGMLTEHGDATIGLHGVNYNTYMEQANKYATEMAEIEKDLAKDSANQDLIKRREELLDLQRDSIKAAEDEKQAMIDLVREGYDAQLEALQKTIDKYKDALKSQKELNDYQKNVSDQAEEVSKLQKMVNVYSKIDTEEGRMKYQEYQNQLKEAQEELDQTEYDKYIADQESLLDDIYSQAEEFINEKLENTDALISELIANTNEKSDKIAETIAAESEAVGYDLSNEMESIWGSNGTVTNVLSTYTGEFADRMTTLQTAIDGILNAVQAEVNASDKQAGTDVVTSTTNNSENSQNPDKTPTTTTSAATTTATQTKTEDTKKDDKIIKIIKKGNSDKAAIAKAKKNYHGTLWYYIVDNYGHIPTFAIYKELGKALGVKAPNGFNTLAEKNKLLKALKAKGYASGTDYVKKDQWANLNEEGQEIITLPDGSILTPVKQGSGIINNPNTEKLLALANDYDKMQQFMSSIGVMNASKQASAMTELERQIMNSQVVNNNAGGNYQITNEITFSLPNVSNYKEFVSQLQHDKQFENMVVDMTLGRANGGSKLAKYKYHW